MKKVLSCSYAEERSSSVAADASAGYRKPMCNFVRLRRHPIFFSGILWKFGLSCDIMQKHCKKDGSIDWDALVPLNSGDEIHETQARLLGFRVCSFENGLSVLPSINRRESPCLPRLQSQTALKVRLYSGIIRSSRIPPEVHHG